MKKFYIGGVACVLSMGTSAFADVHWIYSETDLAVNTGSFADFSGSDAKLTSTQSLYADNAGDSYNWGFSTYANSDAAVDASSGVTLSGLSIGSNTIFYTSTFNDPTNLSGTVDHHYTVYGSSQPLSSFASPLYYHTVAGQNVLDIQPYYSYYGQQAGTVSEVGITIAGNWSQSGTAAGDHELLGLNSDFHVIKNFSYDSETNVTTFSAIDFDFTSGTNGALVRLFGAQATPEPASICALALGSIAFLRRRKK